METGTPLQERPVGWRHPNRNDNRKGCCHSSSLLFLLRLLPSPISLSTRLFDKRLAHSSSWQLLVVPPCLCHTHTRPICLNGVAVAVMRIFPPNLKKKKKEVSVDGERYRQLRPRARELIDQEANENLVGNMWFNIDDDSNLKRERKLFFGSRVRKTLTKPFLRMLDNQWRRQAGSHAYCPYVLTSHLIDRI